MLDTGATGTNLQVTGNASFAEESKLALKLSSIAQAEGQHVVLTAGTLTAADKMPASQTLLPFLSTGTLTSTAPHLTVNVRSQRPTELARTIAVKSNSASIRVHIGARLL